MIANPTDDSGGRDGSGDGLERVAARVDDYGAYARPLRVALALLVERPATLREIVQLTHLPRRSVEELLADLAPDLAPDLTPRLPATDGGRRTQIARERADDYRKRFDLDGLARGALTDPLDARLAEHPELLTLLDDLVARAPAARADLDHVPATARTAARRALWLDATYDLDRRQVLCVGDHDLTSLALAALRPDVTVTVVDVDDALLGYLDDRGAGLPGTVRCRYADLRFGLPPSVAGSADLVFTDPPYTPEGVGLFVARGLAGLRDPNHGRVLLAYGYSDLVPTLGWKVQRAINDLGLVVEAMLPSFHVYEGAEAVGAAADMYVCRPTPATWKRLDRATEASAADANANAKQAIYTRGRQSLESEGARGGLADGEGEGAKLLATATAETTETDERRGRLVFVGDVVPAGITPSVHVKLPTVLDRGLPPAAFSGARQAGRVEVAADLVDDPGAWLLRLLLAVNASAVYVAVSADHADLTNRGWSQLTSLVAAKWTTAVGPGGTGAGSGRRGSPSSVRVVAFTATGPASTVDPGPANFGSAGPRSAGPRSADPGWEDPGSTLVRWMLDRAHGKIGNVWREGLVRVRNTPDGQRLSKRDARAEVESAVPDRDRELLDARLTDLPRHTVTAVMAAVRHSAAGTMIVSSEAKASEFHDPSIRK